MRKLRVNLGERSYNVLIGVGVISRLSGELDKLGFLKFKPLVITNETIHRLYGSWLRKCLSKYSELSVIKVLDSEKSKSWPVTSFVLEQMVQHERGKSIFLIAFGGGVVGDLTGFLASIYKRGIPYIQIPTTLLSQIDSSIGGKVAIDLSFGKNLIGAFYQPKLVIIDLDFLKTLSQSELQNGVSEIIKYGIIKNKKLFSGLEVNKSKIYNWSLRDWTELVVECVKIKLTLVEKDEFDNKDIRIILNFGHTIAHALESSLNYKSISHGQAVAFGMIAESIISYKLGLLNRSDYRRIIDLILGLSSLSFLKKRVKISEIIAHLPYDKKAKFGKLRFVLPISIGRVEVTDGVKESVIESSLKKALEYV